MRFSSLVALMAALLAMPAAAADTGWIFMQGYYTHSPTSGVRVAQYMPLPHVEPLPDSRAVTSGYRRSRTTQRGPNGTVDDHYVVENWGNGRGGLDAEWERFHDAWQSSYLSGGQGGWGPGQGGWWLGQGGWGPGQGGWGPGQGGWGPGQGGWGPGQGGWGPGQGGWGPGQGGWGPGQGGWGRAYGPRSPGQGTIPFSYGGAPGQGYGPGPSYGPPH